MTRTGSRAYCPRKLVSANGVRQAEGSKLSAFCVAQKGKTMEPEIAPMKVIYVECEPELHGALKRVAFFEDTTITALVKEAAREFLKKKGVKYGI